MLETPKVPLALAAQNLATIMEAIDAGNLDDTIVKIFNDQRLDLSHAVDRRLCFFDLCERQIESLKDVAREYEVAARRLRDVMDKIEKLTIETMKTNPDVPYTGSLGRMAVQKNGSSSTEILIEIKDRTATNTVDANDIRKYRIDPEYYEQRTYYCLVMDKIKKAIEAGVEIPWAQLKRGEHLKRSRK